MLNKDFICKFCKDVIPVNRKLDSIVVHGAKEHNLKNVCFEIPKGKLVALTGPSGSGKSTIATDILQKECIRQFMESIGMTTDHLEKAKAAIIMGLSPSIGVSQRLADFNPRSTVGTKTGILTILRNLFATLGHQTCKDCGMAVKQPLKDKHKLTTVEIDDETISSSKKRKISYFDCPHCDQKLEKLKMNHFSFNTTVGACEACKGLGEIIGVNLKLLLNEEKTIRNGGIAFWDEAIAKHYENVIRAASTHYNFEFDPSVPIRNYSQEQKNFLLYGIDHPDFIKAYKNIKPPKKVSEGNFEGIVHGLLNQYKKNPLTASNYLKKYILHKPCIECNGSRLGKLGRNVAVAGKTIIDILGFNLNALLQWINNLDQNMAENELLILEAFSTALKERIANLIEVGLDYLTLQRTLPSLSAGENQRLKLANLLGSGLTGVLYLLDEPTTGLHPNDTAKLLKILRMIQEIGNTVLVIEHDVDLIKKADFVIDIGPAGGSKGGEIIVSGTPAEIKACEKSITGKYLAKKQNLKLNSTATINEVMTIYGASEHNLKNIDVSVPIKKFVVLTGVSGSGKSTFLFDILDKLARRYFNNSSETDGKYNSIEGLDYFNRVVTIDQLTIGNSKSSRSNVATYTKLFDYIRDLFASLPESRAQGFGADKFSFNISDQRCENCDGAGVVEIDMTFMPDIEAECPVCNGMRFNDELLTVQFRGYNISNILNMTVNDAIPVFRQETEDFCNFGFNETSWVRILNFRAIHIYVIRRRSSKN